MTSAAYPIPSPSPSPTPPSPSPTNSSFLYSPTKPPRNQPNAHPYAIKTTSTALLSRSTSSSTMKTASVHHYVPTSPSPTTESPTSPVKGHHHQRPSRHRYSRSLTSDLPAPLPPPPQTQAHVSAHGYSHSQSPPGEYERNFFSGDEDVEDDTPRRRKMMHRAETMPSPGSGLPFPSSTATVMHPDLPEDPKTWSPTQLGVYLASGEASSDVVVYIQERQITGRAFMRLAEGDLESLPAPQRASLLAASRALRQRAMRGRIFGSGSEHGHGHGGHTPSPFTDDHEDHSLGLNTANITRRNGIHIRPRRRSRHSSLASDSSDVSTSSSFSSNASSSGRVRGIVDEFESRLEEEGTADTSYSSHEYSSLEERRASPVKKRVETSRHTRHGAQGTPASPTPTKQGHGQQQQQQHHNHRLPQRAAVTDLFGFGAGSPAPAPGAGRSPQLPSTEPLSFPPANALNSSPAPGSGMDTAEEVEEKDSTITGLARKNVNGREARLLPFPPSVPPQAQAQGWMTPMHTGAQYALPSTPDPSLAYAHGPHGHGHHHQQYLHSHMQPPLPADYELGFRNAVSPSSLPTPTATSSPHPADPHSLTYIVQHNPSHSSDSGSLTAKGPNGKGGAKGQRLLPFPPVVGQGVLHHPRPRRVIGVGDGDGVTTGVEADEESAGSEGRGWVHGRERENVSGDGPSDTETTTETEGGEDAWETANEGSSSISAAESDGDKEEEEEPSMEDLLRATGQPTPGAPNKISGVEAWEMELGETVKRISSSTSSVHLQSDSNQSYFGSSGYAKNTGTSARDVPEIGRRAGRAGGGAGTGGTNRDRDRGSVSGSIAGTGRDKLGTRRGGIMGLFEPPPAEDADENAVKEIKEDVEAEAEKPPSVADKEEVKDEDVSVREAVLDARESELAEREKALESREGAVLSRESGVEESQRRIKEQEASVSDRETTLKDREATLGSREAELSSRAKALDARESELTQREAELAQREEAIKAREESVKEQEKNVEEKQSAVELEKNRVFAAKEEVERRVTELERGFSEIEERVRAEAHAGSQTEAAVEARAADADEEFEMEDLNPTRPKPYLTSPWAIKRDYILGRFMGLFPFPFALFSSSGSSASSTSATSSGSGSSTNTNGNGNGPARRGSILSLLNLKGLTALASQGGGYVVLMSLGMCAIALRVLGRRLLGATGGVGARAGAMGVGRR